MYLIMVWPLFDQNVDHFHFVQQYHTAFRLIPPYFGRTIKRVFQNDEIPLVSNNDRFLVKNTDRLKK
jgi:hypothetical protein